MTPAGIEPATFRFGAQNLNHCANAAPFQILMKFEFYRQFSKNIQILNFMKTHPLGAELLHVERRAEGHDEANGRFSQFCEKRLKCSLHFAEKIF